MVSLIEMLDARERRACHQQELLEQFHMPIISFTMNIAGPVKNNPDIRRGFDFGNLWLKRDLEFAGIDCIHFEEISLKTGNEAFYVVNSGPLKLKRLTADLEEECALGRLFDLDVIKVNGEKVEREELGLDVRRCLICGKPAKECARSRTHSVEELQEKTMLIIRDALETEDAKEAANLACRALLYEVGTSPKPGLVDRFNNGRHKDMDIFTFMNSSSALWPYFENCVRIGRKTADRSPAETFSRLRKEGQKAELAMFKATKGVNTHKGAIFSVGIVCGALGRLPREEWNQSEKILDECAAMTKGLVEKDFSSVNAETAVTNGQKLFAAYGITGIRGQVEAGFPAIRNAGLPVLSAGVSEGRSLNDAGCAALLALMLTAADTNLLARSSMETYAEVIRLVTEVLKENPYPDKETLEQLDTLFIEKNLSPGGSADLLAICYLLYFLKEECEWPSI